MKTLNNSLLLQPEIEYFESFHLTVTLHIILTYMQDTKRRYCHRFACFRHLLIRESAFLKALCMSVGLPVREPRWRRKHERILLIIGIYEFINHVAVPAKYEHCSSRNVGPSDK
jgi:hypothetical protein